MPRVVPKTVHSVSFTAPRPICWTDKAREALTDDLDLNLHDPKHMQWCDEMLAALAEELENYTAWEEQAKDYPSPSSRLEELKLILPTLDEAQAQLLALSDAALTDIKNAGIFWEEEVTPLAFNDPPIGPPQPLARYAVIDSRAVRDQALAALSQLIVYMKRASATLETQERRGRKPSARYSPIARLTTIFDTFYKGETPRREEALKAFLEDAFKFSEIPPPSRLTPLLSQE